MFYGIHLRPVSQEVLKISIRQMSLKNKQIKLLPHINDVLNGLSVKEIFPKIGIETLILKCLADYIETASIVI